MANGRIPTIPRTITIRKDTSRGSLGRELPLVRATRSGAGRRVDGFGVETSTGAEVGSVSTVVPTSRIGSTILNTAEEPDTITQTCDSGLPATQTGPGTKGS